jgi:primosomal replication protein N''
MIRLCPNCNTERPLTEIFCEGTVDAHNCGWDLSAVDITPHGGAAPKPQPIPTPVRGPACRNGHENSPGDLVCSVCGEPVEERPAEPTPAPEPSPTPEPEPEPVETEIEGWRLQHRMSSSSTVRERFAAVRESDGLRGVLTLYAAGSEPDSAIYDLLRKLPRDHVPEIFATGRWCDRAYEVVEEFTGGTLADLPLEPDGSEAIRILVTELGQALHSLQRRV